MPDTDRLDEDYLQAEQPSLQEAFAAARRREQEREQKAAQVRKQAELQQEIKGSWLKRTFGATQEQDDSFLDNTKEVGLTALETAAEQVVRTVGDIGQSLTDEEDESTLSLNSYFFVGDGEFIGDAGIGIPFTGKRFGLTSAAKYNRMRELYEISSGEKAASLSSFDIPDADRPDSVAGNVAADIVKWTAVFAATRRSLGTADSTAGNVARGFAAGAATDFTVFDPHEQRLSNLLKDIGDGDTVFNNAVTQYLAADATDSGLEGRLKNAIEGAVVGGAVDGLFAAVKWLRVRQQQRKLATTKTDKATKLRESAEEVDEVVDDSVDIAKEAEPNPEQIDALDEGLQTPAKEATPEKVVAKQVEKPEIAQVVRQELQLKAELSEDAVQALARSIQEGRLSDATELVNFNETKIDWDSMDDGDSVQQLFYAFEEAAADMLGEAANAPVSLKTTKSIAESIGFNAENAESLFGTLTREGGISARMFAAHQAMVASGRQAVRLAKQAKKTGANEDTFRLHRHIEMHAALMAQVKGSQTEIARALSAMRLMKDAAAESFGEFEEVKRLMGGHKATDAVLDSVLAGKDDLTKLNRAVLRTTGRKIWDVISEVSINGLLSSVKTHVINTASNAGMLVLGPLERYIAAGVGAFSRNADRITLREANAAMLGQINSFTKAFRLAAQAAREGRPVSDIRQRIEFDARKAIRAGEGDTLFTRGGTDNTLQRGINTLGELVRIPGRALLAGDEFFKTISRESELYAQGYRRAAQAASARKFKSSSAKRDWIAKETKRLVANPSPAMEEAALRFARRQTFQENAETGFGPRVERLLNFHPAFKLMVAPFVRTPMNLLRQAFVDRNPVLFAFVSKNREILRQGGPEAQAVIARTISGTGAMMTAFGLVQSGLITGKGERFTNSEKLDKIPEYSIKIGDRYYQYNRFDPLGSVFGLVADLDFAFKHGYDPADPDSGTALAELAQATGIAFMQNALNKTWTKSLADLMDTATTLAEGGSDVAERTAARFTADQLGKAIPYSSFLRGLAQSIDPTVREAWTVRDRIFRQLPGLSDELPPVRDLLGREVTRENAEWFWINPFGANPESDNKLDQELARLSFDATLLPKKVDNVVLTTEQYSEYKRLMFDMNGRGPNLEEILTDVIESDGYQRLPTDGLKADLVKSIIADRRESAKGLLLLENDGELLRKVLDREAFEQSEITGRDLSELREEIQELSFN